MGLNGDEMFLFDGNDELRVLRFGLRVGHHSDHIGRYPVHNLIGHAGVASVFKFRRHDIFKGKIGACDGLTPHVDASHLSGTGAVDELIVGPLVFVDDQVTQMTHVGRLEVLRDGLRDDGGPLLLNVHISETKSNVLESLIAASGAHAPDLFEGVKSVGHDASVDVVTGLAVCCGKLIDSQKVLIVVGLRKSDAAGS